MNRAVLAVVPALALALVLAGCGSRGSPAAEEVNRLWNRAYLAGEPGRAEALLKLPKFLEHPDKGVSISALWALRSLDEKSVVPRLAKLLEHPDPEVRRIAAWTASDLGEKSVAPLLIKLLEDAAPYVRETATEALGRLGEKSAAPRLVRYLEGDVDHWMRVTVVQALIQIDEKSVVPQVAKLLEHPDVTTRNYAAVAFGGLGEAPQITKLLESNSSLRTSLISGLHLRGDKSFAPQIFKLLQDPDEEVRWNAANTLGRVVAKSDVPQLIKLLEDPDSSVRCAAAGALGNLDEKSASTQLAKLLARIIHES